MLEVIEQSPLDLTLIESDFLEKQDLETYQNHFKQYPNQLDLNELIAYLDQNHLLSYFKQEIESIRTEFLYPSATHGIRHNERVLFFTLYLGTKLQLSAPDLAIVLDAAKYHDIGRINDLEDEIHGQKSADQILNIVLNSIYLDQTNQKLLQAIVEIHSISDKRAQEMIKKYQIEDIARFKRLFSILKDSDGLDRIRLTYHRGQYSELDPSYLRLEESKQLIKATHQLYEFETKCREMN